MFQPLFEQGPPNTHYYIWYSSNEEYVRTFSFYSLVDSFEKNEMFQDFIKLLKQKAYILVNAKLIYFLSLLFY